MELKDTVVMMESSDYQERYKAEYYQLKFALRSWLQCLRSMLRGR